MSKKYTGEKWAKKAMCLPIDVMVTEYRQAKDPQKMIDILADQCEVNPCRIAWILDRCGLAVDPKKLPRALRGDESFDYVTFWENSDDAVVCDRIRKQIRAAQSMPEFDEPAREMLKPYPAAEMEPAKNGCAEEKETEREGENVDARMFETDSQFIKRVTEEYGVPDDDLAEMQGESAGITRRREVLMSAAICVCTDRNLMYGEPEDSFGLISQLWSGFLGIPVSENDVMDMMILLKVARNGRAKVRKRDTYVDIAGYAACAGAVVDQEGKR